MEEMESNAAVEAKIEGAICAIAAMAEVIAEMQQKLDAEGERQVERMVATVEPGGESVTLAQMEVLEARLAQAEQQILGLQASASAMQASQTAAVPVQNGRRTLGTSAATLMAKHGIGEALVEASAIDAALVSLPIEQRIAVKSQLLRAGLLS